MPSQTHLVTAAKWDLLIHGGHVIDPANGIDGEYDVGPCDGPSRWRRTAGACAAPTALDAATGATLAAALSASTDANPLVRDLVDQMGPSVFTRVFARMHEAPKLFAKVKQWISEIDLHESFYTKPVEHAEEADAAAASDAPADDAPTDDVV